MYGDGRDIPYQAVEEMFKIVDGELHIRKFQFQPFAPLRQMLRRSQRPSLAASCLPSNPCLKQELKA
jgi:hypothetical protein